MRKNHILGAVSILLAVIIPLACFGWIAGANSDAYSETFVAALGDKFDRLCAIDEPKLVVIGGSSVAFGIDSELLGEKLGMPVVNFGLYATLGTKLMMDLSKANLNEGDIVILSPETDPQTLSLYFNAETAWQAMEGNPKMLRYIAKEDLAAMAGEVYSYAVTKYRYGVEGTKLSPTGVYRSDSFNEYGDIAFERQNNIMYSATGILYDTTNPIELTTDIVSDEFIDYANEYAAWCEKRGVTVYFSFCPMNSSAFEDKFDADDMAELYAYLSRKLDFKVINSPADTAYLASYFYDTNFHLNEAGVRLHTKQLLTALYREEGRTDVPDVELLKRPGIPMYRKQYSDSGSAYVGYFRYERYGGGYRISGVTDAAKTATYLEVPFAYSGLEVLAIAPGALAECQALTELKLFDNLTVFTAGTFSGLRGDVTVYMDVDKAAYMTDPTASLPQVSAVLLDGTEANITFSFSQACFERYLQDYNWQQYGDIFTVGEK